MPRILFLGDIVGRPGRGAVVSRLRAIRAERSVDWVVANAENAAGGAGLNAVIARDLAAAGVDAITLGDHCWDQRGFDREIDNLEHVCRPANLPPQCPGRTHLFLEKEGFRLAVFTLLGNQFMKVDADSAFRSVGPCLDRLRAEADTALLEFHAETTAEKIAMGWFVDGRVAAMVGTHTHVPTADARVLPRGTAYITDIGMSGPYAGVIGRETAPILGRLSDGMPRRFSVAKGDLRICGVLIDIDPSTRRATAIERVEVNADD